MRSSAPDKQILLLGNSLFEGYGLFRGQEAPALMQQKMISANLPYKIINAGLSGDTSAGALQRLPDLLDQHQDLDALVIELGSNDAVMGVPPSQIQSNIEDIIRLARRVHPPITIYLFQLKIWPPFVMDRDYIRQYKQIYIAVARSRSVILLPFFMDNIIRRPELLKSDQIHPNAKGTQIMAENMWQALQPYLKRDSYQQASEPKNE